MKQKLKVTNKRRRRGQGTFDPLVRHPGLYRAQLSCKIGRDALEGKTKPPYSTTTTDYALYNLLHAVEEIAAAMMPNADSSNGGSTMKGTMNESINKPSFDFWALVELFGHQRIAGHVTEQQIGGDAFVRVDVPDATGATTVTRFFGPKAIYSINPTTKEVCCQLANAIDAAPVKEWELPQTPALATGAPPEDHQTHCQECGAPREDCACAGDQSDE